MKKAKKAAVSGILAGSANGLFGSGGGLFLVPLFTRWLKIDTQKAFASSVAVVFCLSAVSFIIFLLKGKPDFDTLWPFCVGGLLGGLFSGKMMGRFSPKFLHRLFGLLLLYGGIKAVIGR